MKTQLPLRLRLANHTHLEDYVGSAAEKLSRLDQLVYVFGAHGSGKSHLLQGLCHEAVAQKKRALYLASLDTLDPTLLDGLEHMDLVCLDDIDTVIGNDDWQIALFHLINGCRDAGNRLVISGAQAVTHLDIVLGDLQSRLRGAYLVQADQLTDDDKLKVIRIKSARRGFDMGEEVCRFILGRSQRDMHHLAHLVEQLDQETLRRQKRVTIPFVKEALGL
jgi:DnaA family protein